MDNIVNDNNMNQPLISVITSVYNVSDYLQTCLESITAQTYKNLDIIIIDNGSTDYSLRIAKYFSEIDTRIRLIKQENQGISAARNIGVDLAKGEYIAFVDSDDEISPDYIESLYKLCRKYETKISSIAHYIVKKNKTIYKGVSKEKVCTIPEIQKMILEDCEADVSVWGKLFKKELFDGIKFPEGKIFEDTAVTYKLFEKTDKVACGNRALYFYKIRPKSITRSTNFQSKMDLIYFTEEMCRFLQTKYPELSDLCQKRIVWAYFSTLNQLLKSSNRKELKEEENKIVKYLLSHKKEILQKNVYTKQEKCAIQLLSINTSLYDFVRKKYAKL